MSLRRTTRSKYEVDLHCHTTASDGLLTPWQLVEAASKIGLKAIGITDHDTISGWEEAEKAGKKFQVKILKGIELNTDLTGTEVHILGYEFNPHCESLQRKLRFVRDARINRMQGIMEKLNELGIEITSSQIKELAQGESVGRPHIAQVLVNKGIVKTIKEAFDHFIGEGGPAYVPRYKLTPEEGINLIRKAGGVAVLAHPGINHLGKSSIPQWVSAGLQGIEVCHSEHTQEDVAYYSYLAEEYSLIMTGGSDFHGEARKPGVNLGGWGTSYSAVHQIRKMASQLYEEECI